MLNRFIAAFAAIFLLFAVGAGCGSKSPPPPVAPPRVEVRPLVPAARISETGYSIQFGAFAVLGNAIRLTERLRSMGEDVYFFRHETGLYKVRLGDFPDRESALARAGDLISEGIVDAYLIVSPEDYALARARTDGPHTLREEIVRTAESFIGLPYQWGGASPEDGFDCSGLAMATYQMNGLNLPRSSVEQFRKGRVVKREELRKGDLVFFSIRDGRRVNHVGIYAGEGKFIHAPGTGRSIEVESLTNGYFRTRYMGGRTFI
jgi:hypothetical protein